MTVATPEPQVPRRSGVALQLRTRSLCLDAPKTMGVLNRTPDSFSDGGHYFDFDDAMRRVEAMLAEGADIIDVGGESTRPGAEPVAESRELERVAGLIEAIVRRFACIVSVDTMKPAVMRAACAAGAEMVNDITALRAPGAMQAVFETGVGACLMHMQGEPRTMQRDPAYADVTAEVCGFLRDRVVACEEAGISRDRLCVDPGFGFGKRLPHNLRLLAELGAVAALGLPVLVGLSRKAMLGEITGRGRDGREAAGLAVAVLAVRHGAAIVRTHDVGGTVDALKLTNAVLTARRKGADGEQVLRH